MSVIVWLDEAEADLGEAVDYLLDRNPAAAFALFEHIRAQVELLAEVPGIGGKAGRIPGTRELVITRYPYIVAFYTKGAEIRILAVIHAKRQWPEDFPGLHD